MRAGRRPPSRLRGFPSFRTGLIRVLQAPAPPFRAGTIQDPIRLDGLLNEASWSDAPLIGALTMTEPVEGGRVTADTRIRVLAGPRFLIIGVEAMDPDPSGIVSTSKARDPQLRAEDYIKIVLDPFLDGRSGYIFAVNPGGARYDALVAQRERGRTPSGTRSGRR